MGSLPQATSPLFSRHSLSLSDCMHESVSPLSCLSPCPSATLHPPHSSSIPALPSISPLNAPPPSSSYYNKSCALACLGLSTHSPGVPYVAPLSSNSSSSSSSVLLYPLPTVAVPLAPVSRGRQSAIGPPLKW